MLHQLSGGEPAGCTPEYLSDPLLLAQALRRRLLSEPLGHFGLEALHVHVHWRNGPIRYHTTPAIAAVPGPGGPSGWAEQLDAGRLGGIALLAATVPVAAGAAAARREWLVGSAKESVDPRPCPSVSPNGPCDLNQNFHLGGYGLGPTRVSLGPLVDPDGTVNLGLSYGSFSVVDLTIEEARVGVEDAEGSIAGVDQRDGSLDDAMEHGRQR